jgi:hypothetical protein
MAEADGRAGEKYVAQARRKGCHATKQTRREETQRERERERDRRSPDSASIASVESRERSLAFNRSMTSEGISRNDGGFKFRSAEQHELMRQAMSFLTIGLVRLLFVPCLARGPICSVLHLTHLKHMRPPAPPQVRCL